MQSVKEASVDWIRRHIVELWPEERFPGEVAESLAALAAERGIPIEEVIEWLHGVHGCGEDLQTGPLRQAAFFAERREPGARAAASKG
jgi:hypothetical protein